VRVVVYLNQEKNASTVCDQFVLHINAGRRFPLQKMDLYLQKCVALLIEVNGCHTTVFVRRFPEISFCVQFTQMHCSTLKR